MKYEFRTDLWLWGGKGAWHFVTLPKDISKEIKENFGSGKRGFGSIRVSANINDQTWKTSIFPDNKSEVYLLPVKAEVRKKADISADDTLKVTLELIL